MRGSLATAARPPYLSPLPTFYDNLENSEFNLIWKQTQNGGRQRRKELGIF